MSVWPAVVFAHMSSYHGYIIPSLPRDSNIIIVNETVVGFILFINLAFHVASSYKWPVALCKEMLKEKKTLSQSKQGW